MPSETRIVRLKLPARVVVESRERAKASGLSGLSCAAWMSQALEVYVADERCLGRGHGLATRVEPPGADDPDAD